MPDEIPEKFNKCLLYLLIIIIVTSGSVITISQKTNQKLQSLGERFEVHHWFTTHGMFFGEFIILFFYIYHINRGKKEEIKEQKNRDNDERDILDDDPQEEAKKKPPVPTNLIFAITAGCDLLASVFSNYALIYLSSSLYEMMRGLLLVFICLWSKIFLHNNIYKHHILGIGCLIFGFILGGASALIYKEEDINIVEHPIKGIILIILSQLFLSGVYIIQEKFIKHYDIHVCQIVGFEGLWGIIIYY